MKSKMLSLMAAAALTAAGAAQAQVSGNAVKIGVLTDMAGAYAAVGGPGAIIAAQMAVEDFGGKVLGKPISIVSADHQNKADIASAKAREWIDREGVDVITEMLNSAVGIAVQKLASSKGVVTINTGAGSTALTNEECTPLGIHYVYDTYSLPVGTATAIVKNGGKKWYFITADYAFGHSLEKNTGDVVKSLGGQVVGAVRAPFPSTDFSSYLLQAQASGANVIGLANAGTDTTNAIKQAAEFGITETQDLAGMLVFITDVHALGLKTAKGLQFTSAWYWDMNDETREFANRFFKKHGEMPTMVEAGLYSAVTNYLKAVEAAGTDEGKAVRAKLGEMTMNDMFHKNAKVRPDGRVVHDMYLLKAKAPNESKKPWDYAEIVSTIPADQAFIPLSQSKCSLVK
jgi:branched-chain amino acid transport system substrate-binding protein